MKQLINFWFVLITAIPVFNPIFATENRINWYQIEVIIFSQSDLSAVHSEYWSKTSSNKLLAKPVELTKPIIIHPQPETPEFAIPFQELSKNTFELKLTDTKLEKSPRYRRLVHKAWIQAVEKDKKPRPVLLDDSDNDSVAYQELSGEPTPLNFAQKALSLDSLLNTTETVQQSLVMEELDPSVDWPSFFPHIIPALPSFEDNKLSENWELTLSDFTPQYAMYESHYVPRKIVGPPYHSVFGTIGLRMNRFLHLDLDFTFRANLNVMDEHISDSLTLNEFVRNSIDHEVTLLAENDLFNKDAINTINDTPELQILYRLQDSMRIKSGKIYYFDHPLFGVITMVNKFQLPIEQNPEEMTQRAQ